MTLINNRAPLLSNIKLCPSLHHHMWIQTGITVWKRLNWVLTSVTLTFDLSPWSFAWTLLWSLVIAPENFMMIRWWEHNEKGVTDGQTENNIHRAAWPQLKMSKSLSGPLCTYLGAVIPILELVWDIYPTNIPAKVSTRQIWGIW